jgi:hypothetical protein
MNRDDIDRMAREVGFPERRAFSDLSDLYPRLERFANLVAAAEREECAQIAFNAKTYIEAAKAIRERGAP